MKMSKNLRELEQIQQNLEYQNETLKVFIADVLPFEIRGEKDMQERLLEVENLVNTYGWVVILKHIQKRGIPDYGTYIGSGKLEEIMQQMEESWAKLLILGNILKPIQMYNINEKLKEIGAKAWDRVDLILKIFEKNAKTTESKLQIELASIKHMGPRIYGMSEELGSQGSGWNKGSRWKWETNTQIMKRHLSERQEVIKKDLEHYKKVRQQHREGRSKKWLLTVGIVGYTNAGKSSLMNFLTRKWVLSEDKLFVTLGTSVGKMVVFPQPSPLAPPALTPNPSPWMERGEIWMSEKELYSYQKPKEILVNDTIGFIRDLPPGLIQAFASTLEDSIEADVLLHVIDASDPKLEEKIQVVDDILENIKATQKRMYVFNKTDLLTQEQIDDLRVRFLDFNPIFISTYNGSGIEDLKQIIAENV